MPWARARTNGKVFFTAPKQRIYKLSLQSFFSRRVSVPFEGPMHVMIRVQLERPKSNKTLLPVSRNTSDVDNWAKIVLDAGNGILWADDSQIVHLEVAKVWVSDSDGEGLFLNATEIQKEDIIEAVEEIISDVQ